MIVRIQRVWLQRTIVYVIGVVFLLIPNGFLHGSQMHRQVGSVGDEAAIGAEDRTRKVETLYRNKKALAEGNTHKPQHQGDGTVKQEGTR